MTDSSSKARRRRLRRTFVLLLVAALATIAMWTASSWSRRILARVIAHSFGRAATVGGVRFHLLPPSVEILDVRVAGVERDSLPFLEIPRIVASPALSPMWVGDIALSRLLVESPKVRVHAYSQGGDDIPRFVGGGRGIVSASVEHLVIERGELLLNHERVPLDLDLPKVRGRLGVGRTGALSGTLAFGPGDARFSPAPALPVGAEIDVIVDGPQVTIPAGHVTASGTDLALSGRLRIATPVKGDFALQGQVDLGVLDRHVLTTGFDIAGKGVYDGRLTLVGSAFDLEGKVEGRDGLFRNVAVPRFAGNLHWRAGNLRIDDLDIEALGGGSRLDVAIDQSPPKARVRGHVNAMDLEGLLTPFFATGSAQLDAAATGDLDLEWPRGKVRMLSGTISALFQPRGDERTPASGHLEWRADNGVETVVRADWKTPSTWLEASGQVLPDDRAALVLDVDSADLAATDDLVARVRRALGTSEAAVAGFGGSGLFRGRWGGTLGAPVFEGRFSGKDVSYLGVTWGAADWSGAATKEMVVSHSLVLHRPQGELWLDGKTETGELGGRDGLDVRLRFRDWPSSDFIQALGLKTSLDGPLTGDAQVEGRRSEPNGLVNLKSQKGSYWGKKYKDLSVALRLRGATTEITAGEARVGDGQVVFHGSLDAEGRYEAQADARDVDVAELLPRPSASAGWGGKASFKLSLSGPLDRPSLLATLSSPHLFLGDEGVGAIDATLRGKGDGKLDVDLRCHSARTEATVKGTLAAEAPYAADLRVSLRETSLDPFLREATGALPAALGIVATGDVRIQGPLASPKDLVADLAAPGIEVSLPDFRVRTREPMTARIEGGRLAIKAFHLTGEDTDLTLHGAATLIGDGPLDLNARGTADLGILGIFSRRLSGRGAASLSMQVRGTLHEPVIDGRLEVEGAGVRLRGFPHGIDDFKGRIRFTQQGAELEDVTGSVAGGLVSLSGQAAFGRGRTPSFDLQATGHGMALRYPEGLRSVVDCNLRLFGDESLQWLTGDVDVRQALWTRRYDLASELLASSPSALARATSPGNLHFDMKVNVPGTFTIDNNLATLTARAELALQGTDLTPSILGRAEVDHGRVYFQGNTYVIRRGTIDFTNPQRIDPLFDIEADARVRSYRVTLKVNGTLERVYPTLTSDPPLSSLQILNLLAGVDENTLATLQTQTDQTRLAATGAATLAAGKLAEEMGLEQGAEKLLGLNRFSVDPSIVRGTSLNPTARLTLGKRITPDLSVLYSVDLRSSQDRLLSVEYTLSDRLSVFLTNSDESGLGFDIELRHSR